MSDEISTLEPKQKLRSIENAIEAARENVVAGFTEIGNRLKEIQESKLYKTAGFNSFEDYCQSRWKMKRAQAYRLISAVATINKLSPIGDNLLPPAFKNHECTEDCFVKPGSEAIARELGKIKDIEELHEVWQQVNIIARIINRPVTARDVEETFEAWFGQLKSYNEEVEKDMNYGNQLIKELDELGETTTKDIPELRRLANEFGRLQNNAAERKLRILRKVGSLQAEIDAASPQVRATTDWIATRINQMKESR